MGDAWGPMKTGKPNAPAYETDYASDPTTFRGADLSALRAEGQRQADLKGGAAQTQFMAGASKAMGPGSSSSDMGRRLSEIASQTAYDQQRAVGETALQEWQSKMAQLEAFNRAKNARNTLANQRYQTDLGAFSSEEEKRAKQQAAMAQVLGSVIGGI